MRVDIEEIIGMEARRKQINYTPLADIEFYKNGQQIKIPDQVVERWRFIGLTNVYFVQDVLDAEGGLEEFIKQTDDFLSHTTQKP